MDALPLWALFGFCAALLSSTQLLFSEKFKAEPLPMAFWCKVTCGLVMIPFVLVHGMPSHPWYYVCLALQSLLWVVSDVIFYDAVNREGAGMIARLLPIATILSFFLWFAYDWPLAHTYLAEPRHSAAILVVLLALTYFVTQLKKCPFSWTALKRIWFVIAASILGTVTTKYITLQADVSNGVYVYVFAEAWIMVAMWGLYYGVKRPVPPAIMFGNAAIKAGLIVGSVSAFMVLTTVYAVYHIDNPAYVSAVKYLDSSMILLFYRLRGRQSRGNIVAGLGIVACAAALVILKPHG